MKPSMKKTVSSDCHYSVDQLQLQAVEIRILHTDHAAILHQLILSSNHRISASNQPVDLKLYRARYPQHMKSKGQAGYARKRMSGAVGPISSLTKTGAAPIAAIVSPIDNSKWRILEQ